MYNFTLVAENYLRRRSVSTVFNLTHQGEASVQPAVVTYMSWCDTPCGQVHVL